MNNCHQIVNHALHFWYKFNAPSLMLRACGPFTCLAKESFCPIFSPQCVVAKMHVTEKQGCLHNVQYAWTSTSVVMCNCFRVGVTGLESMLTGFAVSNCARSWFCKVPIDISYRQVGWAQPSGALTVVHRHYRVQSTEKAQYADLFELYRLVLQAEGWCQLQVGWMVTIRWCVSGDMLGFWSTNHQQRQLQ